MLTFRQRWLTLLSRQWSRPVVEEVCREKTRSFLILGRTCRTAHQLSDHEQLQKRSSEVERLYPSSQDNDPFDTMMCMTVILISGPIASGKSAIGQRLARTLTAEGQQTEFIDLDKEVLKVHGSLSWESDQDRLDDWLRARRVAAEQANRHMVAGRTVVIAGPFYLPDEIVGLTRYLTENTRVFLFVLETPLSLRLCRNRQRHKPSPDPEIHAQDAAITMLPTRYGTPIRNEGEPHDTVERLLHTIEAGRGRLNAGRSKEGAS